MALRQLLTQAGRLRSIVSKPSAVLEPLVCSRAGSGADATTSGSDATSRCAGSTAKEDGFFWPRTFHTGAEKHLGGNAHVLREASGPLSRYSQRFLLPRYYSDAAAVQEDSDVDPSIEMHKQQFLRASTKKAESAQPIIRAYLREAPGKNPNKKERRRGFVPGIVFSGREGHRGGAKQLISLEYKQLAAILQPMGKFFFSAMTWDLEVLEGRPGEEATAKKTLQRVVPKSVHLHAATDEPLNVTFMRVFPDEQITVDVPLVFLGEDACPGLKKGGRLNTMRRLVRYICPGDKVPPYLEVDISQLNIGQSVLLKHLPADPALKLVVRNPNWPVLKITGRTQDATPGEG